MSSATTASSRLFPHSKRPPPCRARATDNREKEVSVSELQLTKDEYHLYVLELVGFGVKVGISKNPRRRLATLRKHAEGHGTPVGRAWHRI
ncbi:hypothetical protein SEA_KENUHA5_45 [Mycobacterium phage Kenuha5]|nr:hypothetical protein SEA_KENUHA5_45 [Mycobacterium phage Kenuha5]